MAAARVDAADAHETLLDDVAPRDRAARRAGPQKRDEFGPGPAGLGPEHAGKERDHFLEPGAGALLGVERIGRATPLADEDDLGRRLQIGQLGVGIVDVPDDFGRRPVEPDQVEQRSQVALGFGLRAAAEWPARRHLGQVGRERRIVNREGVEEEESPSPFLDVIGEVIDLFLSQATMVVRPGARSDQTRSASRARPSSRRTVS